MHSAYGSGHKLPRFTQIIPAEAMTGSPFHDYAVHCALLTASGIMTKEELILVAERTPYPIGKQVAETCRSIVQEYQGFIWLQ